MLKKIILKSGRVLGMLLAAILILLPMSAYLFPADTAQAATVVRNTRFTSTADMKSKLGNTDPTVWSPVYLTEVENTYWTFAPQTSLGDTRLTIDIAKNCYRNLEMLLDNGYTMDYNELAAYCEEYLGKKEGQPDAFYNVLKSCLNNPYLLNKPAATVTATTYNGRDYSAVFDANYYLQHYPDLAAIGNNPPELLRHFVETGVGEGRIGSAAFNVNTYIVALDQQIMNNQLASASYRSLGANAAKPVGKYSYAYANYYGHAMNHYSSAVAAAASSAEKAAASGSSDTATGAATDSSAAGNSGKIDPSTITDIDTEGPDGAEDDSTPIPKDVVGTYTDNRTRSVYTNEEVTSAQANMRPIAVMMPTDKAAQPSYGISRADILYEMMEEGEISRQMAIIPNWQGMNRIGNLRSCRLYYIYAAKEWDPILIHFGGVAYMKGVINGSDMNNLSGTYEYGVGGKAPGAGYFFRTSDRKAPHNAYISSSGIQKACIQQGYSTSLRQGYYNPTHFQFANGTNTLSSYPDAVNASTIDLSEIYPYSKSKLTYNSSTGVYMKSIHGGAQTDALTGKQISFANVIVQNTKWKKLDKKGYLGFDMLGTTEDGWYFTKGKGIHINWKKTSDYEPTRYYDDNGNEIKLNTGKTYIAIAQKGREVKYQ